MQISVIDTATIAIPNLLDANGMLRLLPAAAYDGMDPVGLRLFCHVHARYGLPTTETVAWLREYIGARRAIEIGSGAGDLAYHLNVIPTDSRLQEDPAVRALYELTKQPLIQYPDWVLRFDALDAVAHFKPEVVVASWVTQWVDPSLPPPPGGGNPNGVREDALIDSGVTYIKIGNRAVHGQERALRRPHKEYDLPFLRGRGKAGQHVVYVWEGA